jgi:predicted  nucleic acid-binding Zn-ribbon protein
MSSQVTVTAEILRKLHRMHQQLQDLRDRSERGPRVARAHDGKIQKEEVALTAAQAKVKDLKGKLDERQLHLKSREAEIDRRRQQLREAKDNREFQALRDQIAADEKANSVLEDEVLELMDRLDEAKRQAAEAEATVAKAKEDATKHTAAFAEEAPRIKADVLRIQDDLRHTEQELPGEFKEPYRRQINSKGSDGMAAIRGEFCGGCNQHVPLNLINLLGMNKPVFCRSCGRLLYIPEDGAATK